MKLNKLQRHTAYILLLSEFENELVVDNGRLYIKIYGFVGFCDVLSLLVGDSIEISDLKELWNKKPNETNGLYWFVNNEAGYNTRIELLKQCIQETY